MHSRIHRRAARNRPLSSASSTRPRAMWWRCMRRLSLMLLFVLASPALAEPLPVPKPPGQQYPAGFASGAHWCTPMPGSTRDAVVKGQGACPSGWDARLDHPSTPSRRRSTAWSPVYLLSRSPGWGEGPDENRGSTPCKSKISQSFTRQPSLQSLSWSAAILKCVDARPSPLLYNGHASVHFYSPSVLRVPP